MKVDKKYFSIAEVAQKTGLSTHRLRYIEKSNPIISIVKIRDRRYYTIDTISYIKKLYTKTSTYNTPHLHENNMLSKIENLLSELNKLV